MPMNRTSQQQRLNSDRQGITLLEILVVIGIVAMLLALLMPAVQAAREASRRGTCANNLKQFGVAITNYESEHRVYPALVDLQVCLLPYLDQAQVLKLLDYSADMDAAHFARVRSLLIPGFLCPTDPAPSVSPTSGEPAAATSYGGSYGTGVAGFDGFFALGHGDDPNLTSSAQIRDGLSTTIAMSEILHADGTYHRLRVLWMTPMSFMDPEALCQFCEQIPAEPALFGYDGVANDRGVPWYNGAPGRASYNHALPPNRPSCLNGGGYFAGLHTAASAHAGGVHSLFGDGHVRFIASAVNRRVWRDFGSRSHH